MRGRVILRTGLCCVYAVAGAIHLAIPGSFLRITPDWVPFAPTVIALTGVAELAGAVGLMQPWSPAVRRAAGVGLALYALCVWPANVNHMIMDFASSDGGLGWAYHGPRMLLQPVLIWAALWVGGAIDWPFAGKTGPAKNLSAWP